MDKCSCGKPKAKGATFCLDCLRQIAEAGKDKLESDAV